MMKKLMASMLITLAAATAMTVPAAAKEKVVTSKSGIVTITLPSEKWVEGAADNRCAVFSDGTDYIAFNHYKFGEDKPEIVDPENEISETYQTYQTIYTEKGYYLELTGFCDDEEDMELIRKAISSAEFHMDRMHNDNHKNNEFTVEAVDLIMYCAADELNVRPDGTGLGNPIAKLHLGDEVHITGIVKNKGIATGWVRIERNGMVGYVSNAFLTSAKPGPVEPEKPTKTGVSTEVFYINSNSVIIYEYTDGKWRDDNGIEYWRTVEREWASSDGATLYDYIPDLPNGGEKTGNVREIYWLTGNAVTISEFTDGNWYDENGIVYWYQYSDDTWRSSLGDILYDDPNAAINRGIVDRGTDPDAELPDDFANAPQNNELDNIENLDDPESYDSEENPDNADELDDVNE